jgi:hypothetical protein
MSFNCSSCGKEHDSLPEPAYQRPDDVWALSEEENARRVAGGNDLCSIHEDRPGDPVRFFIRGTIPMWVPELSDSWAVGVWAEVSESDFHRYRSLYDSDASHEPRFEGTIANAVRGFPDTLGASVWVQLGNETQRPTFSFSPESTCSLARLQDSGISLDQIHTVVGHFV